MVSPDGGKDPVRDQQSLGSRADHAGEVGTPSPLNTLVGWLTEYGEWTGGILLYSSAYIIGIAMAYVAIVMVLLSIPPNPAPLVMGLVAFAIYTNDRIMDAETNELSNPAHTDFVRRHKYPLYVLAAIAYGLALGLSILGGPIPFALSLLPGVFWVLYAKKWLPEIVFHVRRLKEVFLVNSFVVAFGWAFTALLLPIGFTQTPLTPSAGIVLGYFFLRSFVNTEIPNIRDITADRAAGIRTLPVVLGVVRTKQVLVVINLLAAALVGGGIVTGHLPMVPGLALLIGIGYSTGVTSFIGRTDNGELLRIAAEFEYVIVGVALAPVVYGV